MNYSDPRVREFAALQIKLGAAIQKGQRLHIKGMPVSCAPYAEILVEEAYKAGAANVEVYWQDETVERLRCLYADEAALSDSYGADASVWQMIADRGDAQIVFFGAAPNMYKGCDASRIQLLRSASRAAMLPYVMAHCAGKVRQCTSAIPTASWAAEVFPDLLSDEAVDALWEAVFAASRITGDGKSVERWEQFSADSKKYCDILNDAHLTALHYKNALGTDFVIGLPAGHIWAAADGASADGIRYFPNLPTEEIYTTPHRDKADGTIAASMPLYWMGSIIRDIRLTMKNGVVIEASASEGEELLKQLLATDEGALHMGECALVSWDSPIRASGVSFANMLFDENAACHFALGLGFEDSVADDGEKTAVNHSDLHMDFMIGTADLEVTGIKQDGTEFPILRNGCFVL